MLPKPRKAIRDAIFNKWGPGLGIVGRQQTKKSHLCEMAIMETCGILADFGCKIVSKPHQKDEWYQYAKEK